MAMKLLSSPSSLSHRLFFTSNGKWAKHSSRSVQILQWSPKNPIFNPRMGVVKACVKVEQKSEVEIAGAEWGKVSAVLFNSRKAGVDVFAEMGVEATVEDFVPFTGTGEANFLGGVAKVKGVKDFNTDAAKTRFFEIYLNKYAKPNSGIGFPGALELITQCKSKGLKVAVVSSADSVKVDANLAAAGIPLSMFDAIVSADAFENLKPAPDIFLAASSILNVPTSECVVIEDAPAGVQAAKAAEMRCIAMTTSVSEEALKNAGPSFIRSNIGSVSPDDILSGGSGGYNGKMKGSGQSPAAMLEERTENGPVLDVSSPNDEALAVEGLQGSRRDILRYGSLGIAVSCLLFTITNWKAMQYASPKATWNLLFGVTTPSFNRNEGQSQSSRIQQFVKYISDLENSSYKLFAQPSGITLSRDFKEAFIADSESSSIRALDLNTGGSRLLVGGDPIVPENLFKVILLPKNRKKTMYTTTTPTTSPHLLPKNLTPESKPIFNFSQKTILHLLTTKCSTLQQIKEVHAVILKTGHFQDHYVSGALVKCYANPHFSNLDFAMTVFNHVPNPNVFVFNIAIKSCLDNNDPFKALDVYCSLVVGNARPNKFTYPTLLKAC